MEAEAATKAKVETTKVDTITQITEGLIQAMVDKILLLHRIARFISSALSFIKKMDAKISIQRRKRELPAAISLPASSIKARSSHT